MKMQILAVKDGAAAMFGNPYFTPSLAAGLRAFADDTNNSREGNQIYLHPADFSLWHIGVYDTDTGKIHPTEVRCLARAIDYYTGPERPPTQYSQEVIRQELETSHTN